MFSVCVNKHSDGKSAWEDWVNVEVVLSIYHLIQLNETGLFSSDHDNHFYG